jgi:two-component system, NtrC family, sensor kinase
MAEALPELGRVLASIAGSTLELKPILGHIAAEARRLCEADGAFSFVRQGDRLYPGGADGVTDAFWHWLETDPPPINETSAAGRAVLTGVPVRIDDVLIEPGYGRAETTTIGNYRSILAVPIRSGDEVIGGFALARHAVAPFSEAAVEVASVFAGQAAIAIRIARLLAAGQEAQDRERSFGQVLASVARASFDLRSVLRTITEEAARLCGGDTASECSHRSRSSSRPIRSQTCS